MIEKCKEETKLYLCDGIACGPTYPELCYKVGGECAHTADPQHSVKKKLGDLFPETIWRSPSQANLHIEEVDGIRLLQYCSRNGIIS